MQVFSCLLCDLHEAVLLKAETPVRAIGRKTRCYQDPSGKSWNGGGHLSHNCDLHNYGCAYGLRLQPDVLYSDCGPSQTDCEWIRSEYWHLGTNVANGSVRILTFGNLGTNVANGSIWILTFGNLGTNVANGSIWILAFGYQCCKWIDLNIDIWQFWGHINVRTNLNKTPNPI